MFWFKTYSGEAGQLVVFPSSPCSFPPHHSGVLQYLRRQKSATKSSLGPSLLRHLRRYYTISEEQLGILFCLCRQETDPVSNVHSLTNMEQESLCAEVEIVCLASVNWGGIRFYFNISFPDGFLDRCLPLNYTGLQFLFNEIQAAVQDPVRFISTVLMWISYGSTALSSQSSGCQTFCPKPTLTQQFFGSEPSLTS